MADTRGRLETEIFANQWTSNPELEAIKARVLELEEEAEKLREVQSLAERQLMYNPLAALFYHMNHEERIDADNRSVYVGNVDYSATAAELKVYFSGCGSVNRVTILCDRVTGHPKGFAYIEFSERDSVGTAMTLDNTLFRGRVIKVSPKRTNIPGITNRGGQRGRPWARGNRFNNGFQGRFRGNGRVQPWSDHY
ncbi:embryonic polyadenylate-binding protein 2 [Alosa sapidissima]|uniref:embryonic polyadenylate-binding protein 2 n=1 Tax=Alosa sapidissima TaxID=34773 RepID=UPI001C0867F3|nr:embryonic polyadenylate-binding protein 2 [Alosa sapidissima]